MALKHLALVLPWLYGLLAAGPAAAGMATLTVGTTPRQTFAGFGFSFEKQNPYGELGEAQRAAVNEILFRGLNTQIIRLWYPLGEPKRLRDDFLARGIIPGALANGVKEILLAPGHLLETPRAHAAQIAEDVATIRAEYGIPVTATGVINEPNAKDWKILPKEDFIPLALAMRRELEARGLSDVTILAPEWASADAAALAWLDVVASEPEALTAFDAFASHSYNMGSTPKFADRVLRYNKEYWMTEAGGPIRDGSAEFDYAFAASIAARLLNDVNNGVTHWIWFLGLNQGTRDPYQKLVMCEDTCAHPRRIYKNYGYHYVQQITQRFLPGTAMRHVTSDLPRFADMIWTYGAKPPLHAAAGQRPDGRWVLGVINMTPGGSYPRTSWDPPEDYKVSFVVPELVEAPALVFELCRTSSKVAVECGETVEMSEGRVALDLGSLELLTLVARDPT